MTDSRVIGELPSVNIKRDLTLLFGKNNNESVFIIGQLPSYTIQILTAKDTYLSMLESIEKNYLPRKVP